MKRNRRVSKFLKEEDTDPLSVVVNLFDVAMVFAVALMVAMVMHMNMTEVFGQEDFTIVKNPGKENMEIILIVAGLLPLQTKLRVLRGIHHTQTDGTRAHQRDSLQCQYPPRIC